MPGTPAASALLRLTPRDRALVGVLHELRYLTATQIQQVCFPMITVASASHRLSVLRRRGLLEVLSHRTFGDRRAFWGLTALGRAAAAALGGTGPDRPGTTPVASLHMDHLIATNQVFCDLCCEHAAGRLGPFRWFGSHHTCVDLGQTHLIPDAVILIASPAGDWWMYLLELDRHTMPDAALAEKFDRYHLMHRISASHRDDPLWELRADAWVLFACGDEERAAAAARLAAGCGLERLWAGTAKECAAGLAAAVGPGTEPAVVACPAVPPPGLPAGTLPPPVSPFES